MHMVPSLLPLPLPATPGSGAVQLLQPSFADSDRDSLALLSLACPDTAE